MVTESFENIWKFKGIHCCSDYITVINLSANSVSTMHNFRLRGRIHP